MSADRRAGNAVAVIRPSQVDLHGARLPPLRPDPPHCAGGGALPQPGADAVRGPARRWVDRVGARELRAERPKLGARRDPPDLRRGERCMLGGRAGGCCEDRPRRSPRAAHHDASAGGERCGADHCARGHALQHVAARTRGLPPPRQLRSEGEAKATCPSSHPRTASSATTEVRGGKQKQHVAARTRGLPPPRQLRSRGKQKPTDGASSATTVGRQHVGVPTDMRRATRSEGEAKADGRGCGKGEPRATRVT